MVERGESGYLASFGVELDLVDSLDKVEAFRRWAGERRSSLCVDTETTGLRPDFDRVRLIQVGDTRHGWAFPFDLWGGAALEVIFDYEGPLTLHNSKFDERSIVSTLARLGYDRRWPWHRTDDTMTMAHLVDSLRPRGLKALGGMMIDPQAVAAERMLHDGMARHKWTWATVPIDFPPYWIYAAMDPVLTAHIRELLGPTVFERYAEPYDLEMGTIRVVADMERVGLRVDPSAAEEKRAEILGYSERARAWLRDRWGISNPSPDQLTRFFQREGVPLLPKRTAGGKQSMDKEVLSAIDHPVAETVLAIRRGEKLVSTYIDNLLELRDGDDRVHANFWTMGARTGRMTVDSPSLQNLPKRDTTIRSLIVPGDGMALVSFDADQIEARLMAHFSGSEAMIAAFNSEEDFFCSLASRMFGEPVTSKKDRRRQLVKGTTYGKIYGGGPETLAHVAGVPLETMEQTLLSFDRSFPEVNALQQMLRNQANRRWREEGQPYVVTPTGRRLVGDEDKDYVMTNYLIQGHAAEILKRGVMALDAALPEEARMLCLVHDEILMEAPVEMVPELMPLVKETLDDLTGYRVPITWGGSSSTESWGALVDA